MRALLVGSIALLLANSARADMVAEGEKSVSLSIRVDAVVPAGKVLVLANTFRGADVIKPGEVQKVEWHPFGGSMQLRLLDSGKAIALAAARESIDHAKVLQLVKDGPACGEPFPGVRTLPDRSPADEVRWSFAVKVAGKRCDAKLLSTEYFDSAGKAVDPAANPPTAADMREPIPPPLPPGAPREEPPAAPAPASPAPAAPAPAPASSPAPAPTPTKSGFCRVGGDSTLPGLMFALLLVARRRRAARG